MVARFQWIFNGEFADHTTVTLSSLRICLHSGKLFVNKSCTKNYDLTLLTEPPQVIGMSATLNNIGDLAKFLNADVYTSDFRPVSICWVYVPVSQD